MVELQATGEAAGGGKAMPLLARLQRGALRAFAARLLHRYRLIGRVPEDLRRRIGERWPGDPKRGAAILAGDIEFAGELVRNPSPAWLPPSASPEWLAAWHGFVWLADLASAGDEAREAARAVIQSWLEDAVAWHPIVWRSDVLASRIFAWITHLDELAGRELDRPLRRAMLASLAAQLRHLARMAAWETAGPARLRSVKGLLAGLVAFGGAERRIGQALRLLEREMRQQILPDGGHRSRNPSMQLEVLRDLIDIRGTLRTGRIRPPVVLTNAIEAMAPMLRLFRHGDRRLALFNDSIEEDGVLLDLVLTRSEAKGSAPAQAPDAGFQRLHAGQTLLILDAGKPPPEDFDQAAHAGMLSFELSQARERIIVNCGGYRGPNPAWRRMARASAAHSVLVVGDTNAVEIQADGSLGRAPDMVHCERAEEEGHQWVMATHDGYRPRFGLTYSRELYLAPDGNDLRGEDKLTGNAGIDFAVRFHLHPAVEASLSPDAGAALLRLPSGAAWRLRATGAAMSLGESVYLGSGEAKKTQQVVVSGTTGPNGAVIRWALRRETTAPARA
jgi:uncharacterized heparinase superfamily protein